MVAVRINRTAPFPARVSGSGSVVVTKTNGIWTIGLDYTGIAPIVPIVGQYATTYVLAFNTTTGLWEKISIANLLAAQTPADIIKVTTGATIGSPYAIPITAGAILFNKAVAAACYAAAPLAASMISQDVIIKDAKGDAFTNNVTINFTGGERCDGLTQLVINNNYGWTRISPSPGGGSWYQN